MKFLKTLIALMISSSVITDCQRKGSKVIIPADYSKFKTTSPEKKTITFFEEALHAAPYALD